MRSWIEARAAMARLGRVGLRVLIASAIGLCLLHALVPKPVLINRAGFSQAIYDRQDALIRLSLSSDEKFRLWTPLNRISAPLISVSLLKEDRHFYAHPGVNPFALLRGAISTALGRRAGGSTITMQLARIRFGIRSSSIEGKIKQMLRALQLEMHYSKDEILEAYLNLAPYGGNVEGAGAASIIYLGKEASSLTTGESLLLSVLPQSPTGRTPESERGRRLLLSARNNLLTVLYRSSPAGMQQARDELQGAAILSGRSNLPFLAPHFADRLLKEYPDQGVIRSTLSLAQQALLERQIEEFLRARRKFGVENATAMLVDYRTMEVRGYVGSADFFSDKSGGQFDGIQGRRSPGSALKPFIYGLAIDQGIIHPQSVLKDTNFVRAAYNPENFEKDFLGPINATAALVRSRNIPALEVANRLERPGLYGFLRNAGIRRLRPEEFYGLSLALGGVEVSMEELVELYAMLANGGEMRKVRAIMEDRRVRSTGESKRLLSPEAAFLVLEMLRTNPRPGQDFGSDRTRDQRLIAWKTGTSYGYRDAWAVGIVGPYVLGVWLGNFNGQGNPAFVGRDLAGVLFFNIVEALGTTEVLGENVVHASLNLKRLKVCSASGQLPGEHCNALKDSWFIPGKSPIHTCSVHRAMAIDPESGLRDCPPYRPETRHAVFEVWPSDLLKLFRAAGLPRRTGPPFASHCALGHAGGSSPRILSPQRALAYRVRPEEESVPFIAVTDGDSRKLFWFVDDKLIGASHSEESLFWRAAPGRYTVRAVDEHGRADSVGLMVSLMEGND